MSSRKTTNPDFLNGVPEMLILRLLSEKAMYGYEIVRAIRDASGEQFEFGEGCIYPILHRLERDGLLRATRETANNRPRIVYRPTAAGLRRLGQSTSAWAAIVLAVQHVLDGGSDAKPALV